MVGILSVMLGHAALWVLEPQMISQAPRFEVAAIKRAQEVVSGSNPIKSTGFKEVTDPAFIRYSSVTLKWLLVRGFGMSDSTVSGPAWLDSEKYDVSAKLPPGATKADLPIMLQQLLVERFGILFRREQKLQKGYGILAAKGGVHLKPSSDIEEAKAPITFTEDHIEMNGATLVQLADVLGKLMGVSVADQTEVSGKFDFVLNVSLSSLMANRGLSISPGPIGEARDSSNVDSASINTALRALGLRLVSHTEMVDYLIILSARKEPIAN